QLKVEQRQRKRRDAAVAAQAFEVKVLCRVGFIAVGPQTGQRGSLFKIPPAIARAFVRNERFIEAPERLQDDGALLIYCGIFGREPLGAVEIVQRLGKAMEYRAGPCARQVSSRVRDGSVNLAIGQACSPLIIADAPEDEPAKNEQVDQGCGFRA